MHQHDIELTGQFARDNPEIIAGARQNLVTCIAMYRCDNGHVYFPGVWLGEKTTCPACGGGMTATKED